MIKTLAMVSRKAQEAKTYFQLWFDGIDEPIITNACEYRVAWLARYKQNKFGSEPIFISCPNPLASLNLVPTTVSLVEHQCDNASNNLKIIHNKPKLKEKKTIGTCTLLYYYKDFNNTMKLVEWIELVLLLGSDQIIFYVFEVHPEIIKVLKYYQTATDKITIELLTIPDDLIIEIEKHSRIQTVQNQMIALNDCLYKHMHEFKFLVPLDIDELLIPSRDEDKRWDDLLNRVIEVGEPLKSSYVATSVFFLTNNNHENETQPEIPSNFFFLQKVFRAKRFTGKYSGPKSFQNTELVDVMHNHFPMFCFGNETCSNIFLNTEDARLHHYRHDCPMYFLKYRRELRNDTVRDETLWKYKDEIIKNVNKTMEALNTFKMP